LGAPSALLELLSRCAGGAEFLIERRHARSLFFDPLRGLFSGRFRLAEFEFSAVEGLGGLIAGGGKLRHAAAELFGALCVGGFGLLTPSVTQLRTINRATRHGAFRFDLLLNRQTRPVKTSLPLSFLARSQVVD
jgi:hypothetical protein